MSSFDTIDNIFYQIKKYILPVAFLVIGIYLLKLALVPTEVVLNNDQVLPVEQKSEFLYAALVFIAVSIVWFLYLLDMIKSIVGYGLIAVMLIGSGVILYMDYASVQKEVIFNNKYAERDTEIKARIMDIKAAEVAFKEERGAFTNSFEDLVSFVKNGTKMDFIKNGALPERKISVEERDLIYGDDRPIDKLMTDEEAAFIARLNGNMIDGNEFQRDTIFIPVMDAIFNSNRYLTAREKMGAQLDFHPDSMMHVPFSSNLATLDTASIIKSELSVSTILIKMVHPMKHPTDGYKEYTVGSVDDNHLRDNWSK